MKIGSISAISQHLNNISNCIVNYNVDNFKIISIACNDFNLKSLEVKSSTIQL